jgi:hypothetical protein
MNDSLGMILYGCETWSLTLREKHRLRVFENRVLYLQSSIYLNMYYANIYVKMYICSLIL